jgi:hypothetical protein
MNLVDPDPVLGFARLLVADPAFRAAWQSERQRDRVITLLWRDGGVRDRFRSEANLRTYLKAVHDGRAASAAVLGEEEREFAEKIRRSCEG